MEAKTTLPQECPPGQSQTDLPLGRVSQNETPNPPLPIRAPQPWACRWQDGGMAAKRGGTAARRHQCLWRHSWRQSVAAWRQRRRHQCLWRQSVAPWRHAGAVQLRSVQSVQIRSDICVCSHVLLLCSAICCPLFILLPSVDLCCHLATCLVPSAPCPLHFAICPSYSALLLVPCPELLQGLF